MRSEINSRRKDLPSTKQKGWRSTVHGALRTHGKITWKLLRYDDVGVLVRATLSSLTSSIHRSCFFHKNNKILKFPMDNFQAHVEFISTMQPSSSCQAHSDRPFRQSEPLKTLFDGLKAPCTRLVGGLAASPDYALWCLLKPPLMSKTMWTGSKPFLIGKICLEELHLIQGVKFIF